jgi:hypothetical protein
MAYTIRLTNGSTLTTIADGTVNTTSSDLTLVGKNYAGYGAFLNENYVHLLENFSRGTAPTTPLAGQIWWDTAGNLKVYTGTAWKTLSSITSTSVEPTSASTGNSWWDTTNEQLYIWNGTSWTLVGPAFSSNTGTSGTIVGTITDTGNVNHVAVNVYVASDLVTIISKDSTPYTPQTTITGFTTIKPGFNLVSNTVIPNIAYYGTADNANNLGFVAASNYARTDIAETFDSTVTIADNNGLTVGQFNNYTASVSSNVVQLTNNINNANVAIRANVGGLLTSAVLVVGASGRVVFSNAISVTGNATVSNYLLATQGENATSNVTGAIRVTGGIGLTGNIYTSGNITAVGNVTGSYFVGTAITAQYADLAERFEADRDYPPGTVVMIGGEKEITQCDTVNCENVLGVISTEPAYLMNSLNGTEQVKIAPPVAMVGRVPVRTVGRVQKGDRLVSAGNGCARSANADHGAVIGRALENKDMDDEALLEAIVKVNI